MSIDLYAGQVPTADELLALSPTYVQLGTAHNITSSTTLQSTAIIVPVDGPTVVELSARYASGGGGIKWSWAVNGGSPSLLVRDIMSVGSSTSTTDGTLNVADMRWRQIATLTEDQASAHFNAAATQLIRERLLLEGTGEIVFRFAQASSNASATTLNAASFATIQKVRPL
ncbi:hypothetical protein [Micromonospora sp. NPDC049891]|uniref:hypothetical protein n=1 Tax=Micromonospora sp. NPDC049891 TaxID=3155655 RepID=UPI0033FC9217